MNRASVPRSAIACALMVGLAACTTPTPYQLPPLVDAAPQAAYRHADKALPADNATLAPDLRADWWRVLGEPQLDALVERATAHNQDLALAQARWQQAQALARATEARELPLLTGALGATRGTRAGGTTNVPAGVADRPNLSLAASWEADLWGRVAEQSRAARSTARASQADLAAVRLAVQAATVQAWLNWQSLAGQQRLLEDSVAAYERLVTLTQNRYAFGVVSRADVAQTQTLWHTARAQTLDNRVALGQAEHALALLAGSSPGQATEALALVPRPLQALRLPAVPAGLPSTLLLRRPDIAAARQRAESANATLGATRAAQYPVLTLSAAAGFQSVGWAAWLDTPSRVWSLGATLAAVLFDGGERRALTEGARANLDATAAQYKKTVLQAFQEVEDQLLALHLLAQAQQVQNDAVQAARDALNQTLNRYRAGAVDTLNVLTAQNVALTAERTALALEARQLIGRVALVRALGGGWTDEAQHLAGAVPATSSAP